MAFSDNAIADIDFGALKEDNIQFTSLSLMPEACLKTIPDGSVQHRFSVGLLHVSPTDILKQALEPKRYSVPGLRFPAVHLSGGVSVAEAQQTGVLSGRVSTR